MLTLAELPTARLLEELARRGREEGDARAAMAAAAAAGARAKAKGAAR